MLFYRMVLEGLNKGKHCYEKIGLRKSGLLEKTGLIYLELL